MMDVLYNRNSVWIPGKSNRKCEAQFYKKQPGLTCAGAAGIQENLEVSVLRPAESGAQGECIVRTTGNCPLEKGKDSHVVDQTHNKRPERSV